MAFFSVFGAYVLVAHFAGRAFSRFVAITTSVLYTLFLTGPVTGIYLSVQQGRNLREQYYLQYPDGAILQDVLPAAVLFAVIVFPLFLGWLASLIYMHGYIRGNSSSKD